MHAGWRADWGTKTCITVKYQFSVLCLSNRILRNDSPVAFDTIIIPAP